MKCSEITDKVGHVVAFVGNESASWGDQDYVHAAQNCRALGIDTLAFKAFDGLHRWYTNPAALRARCQKINAAGCGAFPWGYCYGGGYGQAQIEGECILLQELLLESGGYAMADMEAEWNNNPWAAQHFTTAMAPRKRGSDLLAVTTWADPVQQNWTGVIQALESITDIWVPQEYTNWLATQEQQLIDLKATCIQPAVDILGDFGTANDPSYAATLAKQHGDTTLWLWDYAGITQHAALVKDFAAGSVKAKYPPTATGTHLPAPVPATGKTKSYTVQSGDTLAGIAKQLGLANWFQQLYLPNKATIEAAAKKHGFSSANQGALIWSGEVLTYAHP